MNVCLQAADGAPECDPLWVVSIHLTNNVIGERTFVPVLAAALREYVESLIAPRAVANLEAFVSTNGTKITAAIRCYDVEPGPLQVCSQSQMAQQ